MLSDTPSLSTQPQASARWLRPAFVALIVVNFCFIGLRLLLTPTFFSMPGSLGYLLEPTLLLVIYVVVGLIFLSLRRPSGQSAIRIGTQIGTLTGILWIINQAIETFAVLPTPTATLVSGVFFLGVFLLWGLAGFLAARQTQTLRYGMVAAWWSAMLTVLFTIAFGFLVMNLALPHLAAQEINDPDFLGSGWNNVTLFAIANTLDAGFTHLLEAPFIAAVFGIIGSVAGRLTAPKKSAPALS